MQSSGPGDLNGKSKLSFILCCPLMLSLRHDKGYIPAAKPKSFGLRIAGQMWRRKRKLLTAEYFDWDSGPNLAMTVCCRLLKISRSGLVIN